MPAGNLKVAIKRVYDEPTPDDGTRVLVDRLWPRGLARERARIDLWLKEGAPSTDLRRWFNHEPQKFAEFRRRYQAELAHEPACTAFARLQELAGQGPLTLLYAAKDSLHNNAVVLRELLLHPEEGG